MVRIYQVPLTMSKKIQGLLLLVVLGAIWGSSFIFMKWGMMPRRGVDVLNYTQVASLRILIASLVLLPFSIPSARILFGEKGKYFLIVGLCGNLIPSFLFTYANTAMSGGLSGILNSVTPIFTVIIGFVFFRTAIHWLQLIGIFISTFGVIFLLFSGNIFSGNLNASHFVSVLCATLLYGISVNTIKHKLTDVSPLVVSSLGLASILPFALVVFIQQGTFFTLSQHRYGGEAFFYVLVLGCVGTAISNIYFNKLIKLTSALFASSVTYLIPFFAVLFGSLNHEKFTWMQFCAMIILLSGVCLVNFHEFLLKNWRFVKR